MSFICESRVMVNIFTFQDILKKKELQNSAPLSDSNLRGFRFEVERIFENSLVIVSPYLLFICIHQVHLEKLSIITSIYLKPLLFEIF